MIPCTLRNVQAAGERRGATVVEFALTIPLLLMLVMAGIEFSRANVLINTAKVAAVEGARRGIIVGSTASKVEAVIRNELSMVGVAYADVLVAPEIVTDDTELITVGVSIPLDHRNGYIIPKYFVGDYVWKITGMPREAENGPGMNERLASAYEEMKIKLHEAAEASLGNPEAEGDVEDDD